MNSTGIDKIASNIPEKSWNKLVDTACDTFVKVIYPLTATTEGLGRLIERKFSQLNEEQKVIAAGCIQEASEKTSRFSHSKSNKVVAIKPLVIYEALESTDSQTDETMRELWSNLLATEFSEGSVHPEIAKILGKITAQDALLLANITQNEPQSVSIKVLKALMSSYTLGFFGDKKTFNHTHLENIGLIHEIEKSWYLTVAGKEFIRCVSDPG